MLWLTVCVWEFQNNSSTYPLWETLYNALLVSWCLVAACDAGTVPSDNCPSLVTSAVVKLEVAVRYVSVG